MRKNRDFGCWGNPPPDAMVIVNQAGQIVIVNSQTERLFGYEKAELLGKSIEMLMPNRLRAVMRVIAAPILQRRESGIRAAWN